jgi:hypothetical protein
MASAAELTEPRVLAHAKRRLFPESEADSSYAVVDTQFTADRWLADGSVDEEIRSTLAPFNHVRVGSGYPDLVGVTLPDDELIAVDRFGDEPPMVVVEANGYTDRGVDVERGVVQAHDRLDEANAAYVAAPVGAVSQSNRTLARELNVGVLAVTADGGVQAIEVPRVVGNRTTTETSAIRFQASAQGVTDRSFSLNHRKNYLAYPVAVAHRDDADDSSPSTSSARRTGRARGRPSSDWSKTGPTGSGSQASDGRSSGSHATSTARSTRRYAGLRPGRGRETGSTTSHRGGGWSLAAWCTITRQRNCSWACSSGCRPTISRNRASWTSSPTSTSFIPRSRSSSSSAEPTMLATGSSTRRGHCSRPH